MKNKKVFLFLLAIAVLLSCFTLPAEVFARAGGGGGGKGGGILMIILWPFLAIYSAIVSYWLNKRNKECRNLFQKLEKQDGSWDLDKVKRRVEETYFKVQEAWMKRDQDIAKDYMSERLYAKHKMQTEQMREQGRKNMLEKINLIEAKVAEVADYKDDSKDRIWVHIKGSMIDYTVDDKTYEVLSGQADEVEEFTELWKFTRGPKGWVLDEIDQEVSISDLKMFHSFSEEIN